MDFYYIEESYPSTEVEKPNFSYAKQMVDNIGGRNSEMTAISSYFFNSLCGGADDIKNVFNQVGKVEMHHLHIFGELARNLGEKPLLWSNCGHRRVWWSPSYTDYPMGICDLLEAAIQGETAAIEKYQSQTRCIGDHVVKENLRRIIADEELHVKIFTELYRKYA